MFTKLKKNYLNFFITAIIPLLIWGPFFPDLILSLLSFIFLIYLFRRKLYFYFTTKPLIIFLFFASIVFQLVFLLQKT